MIGKVSKKVFREALLKRLLEFGNDPKKAFTGKNSLEKNPIYLDNLQTQKVPEKVKLVEEETVYTIRKPIDPNLKLDKIIDAKVKSILEQRLQEFGGDPKKAFVNLDENPIWLNKEKRISIKNVTITGISNAVPLHDKKDKFGNLILDKEGKIQPVDFVSTSNNHHVAVYKDSQGNLQENVISFFEALARVNAGLPIIDKSLKKDEGWEFLFSMKQNEYFVFPNSETGFDLEELDLTDKKNFNVVSPNLFRVQKIGSRDYVFRHHLETELIDSKELEGIIFHRLRSTGRLDKIQKVRINHLGEIVQVGEY